MQAPTRRLLRLQDRWKPLNHTRTLVTGSMASLDLNSRYRLLSGHEIPVLGYGLWQTPAAVAEEVCGHAFKAGYRHVDSARVYRNEGPCAEAIKKCGIPRSEIFFTSKIPPNSMGYEAAKKSIQSSFSQTGLDYIDLYLIHAPYGGKEARTGTWRALVKAQQDGKIKSIGVSNYGVHHLDELKDYISELETQQGQGKGGEISVGQWELHPWLTRPDIVAWCKTNGVVAEAYCPIVRGQRFGDEHLQAIAKKHGKTPAQVLLRWSLQMGFVPLPKSVTESRIYENASLYDFELPSEDMQALTTDKYEPCSWDPTTSTD